MPRGNARCTPKLARCLRDLLRVADEQVLLESSLSLGRLRSTSTASLSLAAIPCRPGWIVPGKLLAY